MSCLTPFEPGDIVTVSHETLWFVDVQETFASTLNEMVYENPPKKNISIVISTHYLFVRVLSENIVWRVYSTDAMLQI